MYFDDIKKTEKFQWPQKFSIALAIGLLLKSKTVGT